MHEVGLSACSALPGAWSPRLAVHHSVQGDALNKPACQQLVSLEDPQHISDVGQERRPFTAVLNLHHGSILLTVGPSMSQSNRQAEASLFTVCLMHDKHVEKQC